MANKFKEKPKATETKAAPKENRVMKSVASVVSGSFLSKEATLRNLPYVFFLSFVAVCYIAIGYNADDQVRKQNKLMNEINELRTQYIVIKDSLVIKSKQTEVARALARQNTGIRESVVPPIKIVVKKVKPTQQAD
jgi:hypothetical protein